MRQLFVEKCIKCRQLRGLLLNFVQKCTFRKINELSLSKLSEPSLVRYYDGIPPTMFIQLHTWLVSETIFNWRVSLCNWTNNQLSCKMWLELKKWNWWRFYKIILYYRGQSTCPQFSFVNSFFSRQTTFWRTFHHGEKLAQPSEGGDARPPPFTVCIYPHVQSCSVRSS
jgi:hypothetical protein